ncbi:hypothetical protein CKO51_24125 [Rhodopirellula sp. SM50]|nr:hypothetical protein CKO51_24125 [Rhodopirellula sp. SM50]
MAKFPACQSGVSFQLARQAARKLEAQATVRKLEAYATDCLRHGWGGVEFCGLGEVDLRGKTMGW